MGEIRENYFGDVALIEVLLSDDKSSSSSSVACRCKHGSVRMSDIVVTLGLESDD